MPASSPPSPDPRRSVTRSAGVVALGTLSSRVLGAVRDAVIAACFAVHATDTFFVAFTIPNALRMLLGEGAVSGAFVPVFSEVRQRKGEAAARLFFGRLLGAMLVVLTLVTVLGVVAAPWLVMLYAGGYEAARFDRTVSLTRVVFPYIFLMGVAAVGTAALHSVKRFATVAFAPALLNVALIAAPFVLVGVVTTWGLPAVGALAVGALIGGTLHVVALAPTLRQAGLWTRPRIDFRDPSVRRVFRLMAPLLAGLGVYQVNIMLSRLFASFLPAGAQSYLYYGQRIAEIPQGMFALAIASAVLPTLSDLHHRGETERVREMFGYGLRLSLFVALPASLTIAAVAEPTAAVLFGRGAFSADHVHETARSLVWQAAGIWAVASVRTVVPMYHALGDTKTPVVASALNLIVFASLSLGLMNTLAHVGIAVAFSAAATVQLGTLLWLLRRRTGPLGLRAVVWSAARTGLASLGAAGAAAWVAQLGTWSRGGNDPRNLAIYVATVGAGAVTYLVLAKLLRCPELADVHSALQRRKSAR